ncbi:MAG: hypothetical protein AAF533_06380 [Acidobacteriota bacterium]
MTRTRCGILGLVGLLLGATCVSLASAQPPFGGPRKKKGAQKKDEANAGGLAGFLDPKRITVPTYQFDPLEDSVVVPGTEGWTMTWQPEGAKPHAILQVTQQDGETLAALAELGVEMVGAAGATALIVRVPPDSLETLAKRPEVRWAGELLPGHRLGLGVLSASTAIPKGQLAFIAKLFKGEASDPVVAAIKKHVPGATVREVKRPGFPEATVSGPHVSIDLTADGTTRGLQALAGIGPIKLIELRPPPRAADGGDLFEGGTTKPGPFPGSIIHVRPDGTECLHIVAQ